MKCQDKHVSLTVSNSLFIEETVAQKWHLIIANVGNFTYSVTTGSRLIWNSYSGDLPFSTLQSITASKHHLRESDVLWKEEKITCYGQNEQSWEVCQLKKKKKIPLGCSCGLMKNAVSVSLSWKLQFLFPQGWWSLWWSRWQSYWFLWVNELLQLICITSLKCFPEWNWQFILFGLHSLLVPCTSYK